MDRKTEIAMEGLEVTDIEFNEDSMTISWTSKTGWGEYWIGITEYDAWEADSGGMDKEGNKEFLSTLLAKASEFILKKVLITD